MYIKNRRNSGKVKALCFVSSLVLAESFVLRNPPLRQAPKR